MALTSVRVTGKYVSADGLSAVDPTKLVATPPVKFPGEQNIYPVSAKLKGDGEFLLPLFADSAVPLTYSLQETLGASARTVSVTVPAGASGELALKNLSGYTQPSGAVLEGRLGAAFGPAGQRTADGVPVPKISNIVTDFQSGHGFTFLTGSGTGTLADDTSNFTVGSQSLSFAIVDSAPSVQRLSITPSADATDKALSITVQIDDTTNLNQLIVYVTSDPGFGSYYSWTVQDNGLEAQRWFKSGEWQTLTLSFADAAVIGTPNRAALNTIRLRAGVTAAASTTVRFNRVALVPAPRSDAVVSICVDDLYPSTWALLRSITDKYGIPVTVYAIPERATNAIVSLSRLHQLEDVNGWEVAGHGLTDLTTMTLPAAEADVVATRRWLQDNGFRGVDHYAYPGGGYNPQVEALLRRYYRSARTIVSRTQHETTPPANAYRLRSRSLSNTTPAATVIAEITAAKANGSWYILDLHDIVTANANLGTQYLAADLDAICAHIATLRIPVRTVGDVLAARSHKTNLQPRTHVVVNPDGTGNYTTLAGAFADNPTGNVHIELVAGVHTLAAPLTAVGVQGVTISGQGRTATTVNCAAGFIQASGNSDGWSVYGLRVQRNAGANTDDGINVDYPRRWSVRGCYFDSFGGSSIRYRGGIHSEIEFNFIIAKDSTNTNGLAGVHVEKSSGGVPATIVRSRGNYIGSGKQYGILVDSANIGCEFSGDAAELCDVGMRFVVCDATVENPYTEANRVTGIQLLDSPVVLVGRVRDEPVVTWVNIASADRVITRLDRYYVNPGKAIVFGGSTGGSNPNTSPSVRWGPGSPEAVVTGVVGSEWNRTDGGAGTTKYIKESGTGNTGWVAK